MICPNCKKEVPNNICLDCGVTVIFPKAAVEGVCSICGRPRREGPTSTNLEECSAPGSLGCQLYARRLHNGDPVVSGRD